MPGSNLSTDENKAKHRGRAYQRLRCLQTGKEVINVKARIEDHLMKHHLSLDQVPYYCTLCLFKCKDENTLKEDVRKFPRHALIAAEKGISTTMQEGYLNKNPQPYLMGTEDYYILSTEESAQYFLQRSQQKKTSHQNQDLLSEAVQEICTPSLSQGSLPEAVPKSLEPSFAKDSAVPSEQLWSSIVAFVNQVQKHTPPRSSADINIQCSNTATSTVSCTATVSSHPASSESEPNSTTYWPVDICSPPATSSSSCITSHTVPASPSSSTSTNMFRP